MLFISLICHTPIVIRATRALFQQFDDELYPWNRGRHVRLMPIEVSARPMAAFSGFYESHEPPPSGDARGIVPPHHDGHQNGQQSGYILHLCFVCCCPGGRRGNTEWVVAGWQKFSGFYESPGHAASGDAACTSSTPPHGHWNGLQRRCIRSLPPAFLLGIILAKDHVMVH